MEVIMSESKITFACPGCGHLFIDKNPALSGTKARCRHCNHEFVISAAARPAAAVEASPAIQPAFGGLSVSQAVMLAIIITFAISGLSGFFLGGFLNKDAADKYRQQKTIAAKQADQIAAKDKQVADEKTKAAHTQSKLAVVEAEKRRLAECLVISEFNSRIYAYDDSFARVLKNVPESSIMPVMSTYAQIYEDLFNELDNTTITICTAEKNNILESCFNFRKSLTGFVMGVNAGDGNKIRQSVELIKQARIDSQTGTIMQFFAIDKTTRDYFLACYPSTPPDPQPGKKQIDATLINNR
jgi:predicted RNA-binding Zn-ribbon protein involved in translation (DUF1610 family)